MSEDAIEGTKLDDIVPKKKEPREFKGQREEDEEEKEERQSLLLLFMNMPTVRDQSHPDKKLPGPYHNASLFL